MYIVRLIGFFLLHITPTFFHRIICLVALRVQHISYTFSNIFHDKHIKIYIYPQCLTVFQDHDNKFQTLIIVLDRD